MRIRLVIGLAVIVMASGALRAAESYESAVLPFVSKHCTGCHNDRLHTGNINLSFPDARTAFADDEVWEKVLRKLESGQMPPPGAPRPGTAELQRATSWIAGELARLARNRRPDPGRVTARRLNRAEYNASVRDLLGVTVQPADDFPADDSGYGFDNIGDVLSLSPVLMEKYFAAAGRVARAAIWTGPAMKATLARYPANTEEQARRIDRNDPKGYPYPPGAFEAKHLFPVEAEYGLVLKVKDRRADKSPVVPVNFYFDGRKLDTYQIQDGEYVKGEWEVRRKVTPGDHVLYAAFPDAYVNVEHRDPKDPTSPLERRIFVDHFEIRGPYDHRPAQTASYKSLLQCDAIPATEECGRQILTRLARRAYRRPARPEETESLMRLFRLARQQGDGFEEGIQLALRAILTSPHFLFRIERDPAPTDPTAVHPVSDLELASRLSYFLWSSLPDDHLLGLAEQGQLRQPGVLEAQVRRMLADGKARALVENFAGQWLQLRNLKRVSPDPQRFPQFDDFLREAMSRETDLFLDHIIKEDRSLLELLEARYTFLNARLARHYGIEGVRGHQFRRVDLTTDQRGGLLTQASILTVSSYPTRTSPVLRGLWVLENLLGAPPPPPPADVPQLDEQKIGLAAPLRTQLEQHRANAGCAVCHNRMDPIGFALENYDPIGAWRTHDGRFPIDTSGRLPDGRSFQSSAEFRRLLAADRGAFCRTVTERLLTYALGRGLERYDRSVVDDISARVAAGGYRFSTLVIEIARSQPFQMRRGDAGPIARTDSYAEGARP